MSGTLKPDDVGPAGPVMGGFSAGGGVTSPARAYNSDTIEDIRASLGEHAAAVNVALQGASGMADKQLVKSRAAWFSGLGSTVGGATPILAWLLPSLGIGTAGIVTACGLGLSAVLLGAGIYFGRVASAASGGAAVNALTTVRDVYSALEAIWPLLDAAANAMGRDLPDHPPALPAALPGEEKTTNVD